MMRKLYRKPQRPAEIHRRYTTLKKLSLYIKLLALSMAAILTLCACSGDNATSSDDSSIPDYVADTSAKVGYVYNEEVSHDNMTYMFEKSSKDIETALGLET